MTETVRTFIDKLDGNGAVAKATGYTEGAVALWVHRNRLPRNAWPELMKAFSHVTLDSLLALEASTAAPANDTLPQSEAAA
jgi:hypothetical protein